MDHGKYLIDELCRRTGFPRRTVRYYVQAGLVDPPAGRGRGGFYTDAHVAQLGRIRELQEKGFRREAIRSQLSGTPLRDEGQPASRPASPPQARLAPAEAPGDSWSRYSVAPGVELHLSARAEARLGPAVTAALRALRSVIENQGGLDE